MAEKGWLSKYAFQNEALAKDSVGRSAMEDQFVNTAKIEDGAITLAKFNSALILYTGVYGYSHYGSAVYG